MREILFRGKLLSDGSWSEGNLNITKQGVTVIRPDITPIGTYGRVDPETVGQYIGLEDANGTKIFEGDIVEDPCDGLFIVRWEDNSCGFEPFSDSKNNCGHCGGGLWHEICKVIGNIHDNPELLEVTA